MQDKKQIGLTLVYIVIIILIIGIFAYLNNKNGLENGGVVGTSTAIDYTATSTLDGFAQCVADNGLTMYGAKWCSHCVKEKQAFGSAFKYISYVECPDNIKLCTDKGINGYPTWIDGTGKKHEGEQGPSGLAKITGCVLP
jgi:hypothetical protein